MSRMRRPLRIEGSRRWYWLLFVMMLAAYVAALVVWRDALWQTPMGMESLKAWSGLILFGGFTLIGLGQLLRPARLEISADRLEYSNFVRSWGCPRDQIDQIRFVRAPTGYGRALGVVLKPDPAKGGRKTWRRRLLGYDHVVQNEFEMDVTRLHAVLTAWLARP